MGSHYAEDLEKARPKIQEGDVVMINTGMHHKWADSDEYFAYGPGANAATAQWMIDKKVKMVGYGCQANDHPIATKLVDHGLGPSQPHLIDEYKKRPAVIRKRISPIGSPPQDPEWSKVHPPASKTSEEISIR